MNALGGGARGLTPTPRGRRRGLLLIASLAVAGALAAAPALGSARSCHDVSVGQKHSGRTLSLHVCQRLTIRLKEAFDGGYQWSFSHKPSPSVLKLLSNKAVFKKGTIGGYDTRVIVYRVVGKGRTWLKLKESRSFQEHSQIAKFKLTIRVR